MVRNTVLGALASLCLLGPNDSQAQIKSQAKWQQKVNHTIQATLGKRGDTLYITQEIEYTNNSPEAITFIYFHMWPEAFANKQTEFGKESRRIGTKTFVNATKQELSEVRDMKFELKGTALRFKEHEDFEKEVLKVFLDKPLEQGQTTTIKNSCAIYLPAIFSRFGRADAFYSMTQWYPKPAVYDVNGWNIFPYKSLGEYYSEYGKYKVSITVPSNYIVAATGELQTESEIAWLNQLHKGQDVREKGGQKTVVFEQDNVHDFAWFTSPNFTVKKEAFKVNGSEKTAWAFIDTSYTKREKLDKINESVIAGVKYYSKRVGAYPYKHCTAVIGPLKGAGGMEYPMITICESGEESTVVHEVGHNWFQGMLGSNERVYPWMDESINTFYQNEQQIAKNTYEHNNKSSLSQSNVTIPAMALSTGSFQVTGLHSHDYSNTNYGISVYMNGPLQFSYLQEVLGKDMFDTCMKTYFNRFSFKHPLPDDIKNVFAEVSGKNMDWFFDKIINSHPSNFKIRSQELLENGDARVELKNKGAIPISYEYNLYGVKYTKTAWENTITLPSGAKNLELNPNGFLLETNYHDNYLPLTKGKKMPKNDFGLLNILKRGQHAHWLLPNILSHNMHDGWSPGIILSNANIPRRNYEYYLLPSYGLRSKNLVGQAKISKLLYTPSSRIELAEIGVASSRYSFYPNEILNSDKRSENMNVYTRIRPEIKLILARKNHWQGYLNLDYSWVAYDKNSHTERNINTQIDTTYLFGNDRRRNIFRAEFRMVKHSKMDPSGFSIELSHDIGAYSRAIAKYSAEKAIGNPTKKKMYARIEAFAVANLVEDYKQAHTRIFITAPGMSSDAAFREISTYRNQSRAYGVNQFQNAFVSTSVPSIRFPMPIRASGNYLLGFNAQSHFVPFIPVQIYFDGALATAGLSNKDNFWWTSGLVYSAFSDNRTTFEVSLPIMYSQNLKTVFNNNYNYRDPITGAKSNVWNWYQMFQFKLNIAFGHPYEVVHTIISK
jgi:hypothetical protein